MSDSALLTNKPVVLSCEDRNRMSRLYEEVRIRLEEMAMITARTLKMKAARSSSVTFCPFPAGVEMEVEAVELIRTQLGRGCYDYRQGTCFDFEGAGAEARPTDNLQH
jgi:hypothetical protein